MAARDRSALEVLVVFAKLGTTSFGGPLAHLGYFRDELVVRRRWLDDAHYADLVALCQFLPGPTSSQVGVSVGIIRAGYWGGLAAWIGFTLPSAVLMTAFALGIDAFKGTTPQGMLHGLKLVAVAIVAQAVWGMARTLCPDRVRAAIAVSAAVLLLSDTTSIAQIGAICMGGIVGAWLCRSTPRPAPKSVVFPVSRGVGIAALGLFLLLFPVLFVTRALAPSLSLFYAFYRSGALVFGGGHVVLPLLSSAFVSPGWVSQDDFLAGYGAAQALPGPLFTFAAYLGAIGRLAPNGIPGAALGLLAIFIPGLLILVGVLPFWDTFRRRESVQATMRGINAAMVGVLGATLYDPVWTHAVKSVTDFIVALAGFFLLVTWRTPPLIVVILGAAAGAFLQSR